jgi:hypothetical protein
VCYNFPLKEQSGQVDYEQKEDDLTWAGASITFPFVSVRNRGSRESQTAAANEVICRLPSPERNREQ